MQQAIRILQMIGNLNYGGSQSMIINLYKTIDRTKIQFDFIVDHSDQVDFVPLVKSLGAKVYYMPKFKGYNILNVRKAWINFFRTHPEYKVLHSHVRSYASLFIPIAKRFGIKTIIHSHSTSNGKGAYSLIKSVMQFPLRYQADYLMGCSIEASVWLYGKNVLMKNNHYLFKNAIDISSFKFDNNVRNKYRDEFLLGHKTTYIHVGRFHESKNHTFLIEVFEQIHFKDNNSVLLLVGEGPLRAQIESIVLKKNLSLSVFFMGNRDDVSSVLQASDCFLFPSKWEGLPLTVVEAQASGMKCIVSDKITDEVILTDLVIRLPIDKGADLWTNRIQELIFSRFDYSDEIRKAGYDIKTSSIWLTDFYTRVHCDEMQ